VAFPPDSNEPPDKLRKAVITFEDESFYRHPGIDIKAVFRAIGPEYPVPENSQWRQHYPYAAGKNESRNSRTWLNKLKEAFFAIKLDLHFSKDELLKLYLDHAPMEET
jgi:penicillin-binding protein 1C